MTTPPDRRNVLVRVWLPDRPGALGLVAARIGSVGGDIVGVEVVERGVDVAVDEFAVVLDDPGLLDLLVREVEEVDGASVEEIRDVGAFPDPRLDALESAAVLTECTSVADLWGSLPVHVGREFVADWSALVAGDRVVSATPSAPDAPLLVALAAGTAASPLVTDGVAGPADLAVAALPAHDALLLVGRDGHVFRRRERAQLVMLARVADRIWTLLERESPAPGGG